jgi:hypothetical protein
MIRHGGDFFGAEDDAIALAVGEELRLGGLHGGLCRRLNWKSVTSKASPVAWNDRCAVDFAAGSLAQSEWRSAAKISTRSSSTNTLKSQEPDAGGINSDSLQLTPLAS